MSHAYILKKPSPYHPISHICIRWQLLPLNIFELHEPPSSGRYRHYVTISDRGQSPWRSPICFHKSREHLLRKCPGGMILEMALWVKFEHSLLSDFEYALGPFSPGGSWPQPWHETGMLEASDTIVNQMALGIVSTFPPGSHGISHPRSGSKTKITNITNKTKSMSQLFNLNPNYPTYFLILLRSPPF